MASSFRVVRASLRLTIGNSPPTPVDGRQFVPLSLRRLEAGDVARFLQSGDR